MTRRGKDDGDAEGITFDRRDLLRGGAAVGTFALASRIETFRMVMEAQAQANEPRLQLGSDYFFDDDGSELVISHDTQGDILRYDPTADQITTLKPLTSVTTGSATFDETVYSGLSTGVDNTLENIAVTGDEGAAWSIRRNDDVSTSTTTIWTRSVAGLDITPRFSYALVCGIEDDNSNVRFFDLVIMITGANVSVVDSAERGSPAGRTYSFLGSDLQLAMASDTYDIMLYGTHIGIRGTNE